MKSRRRAASKRLQSFRRRLNFEGLETRRLLATMTDGTETLVNNEIQGAQSARPETVSVAGNTSGEFAVVFEGKSPSDKKGVYLRRFDDTNAPIGSQQLVNVTTSGNQTFPSVAMGTGGEMVVAWSGKGAGDSNGVFTRLYDNSGTPVSGEILERISKPILHCFW